MPQQQATPIINRTTWETDRAFMAISVKNSVIVKLQTFGNGRNSVILDCVASLSVDQKVTQDFL